MRGWRAGTQMGNLPITSDDKHSWEQEYEYDLVALDPQSPSDPFSLWTREKLIPHYHWYFGRKLKKSVPWAPDSGVAEYAESGIQLAVNVISTVVSCLCPVLSIVVLYYVQSMNARLGIVAAFTAIFSSSLALLTGAKRVEIFAATSA